MMLGFHSKAVFARCESANILVTSFTFVLPVYHSSSLYYMILIVSLLQVTDSEKPALREGFLKKYPDAFWVDFDDFK